MSYTKSYWGLPKKDSKGNYFLSDVSLGKGFYTIPCKGIDILTTDKDGEEVIIATVLSDLNNMDDETVANARLIALAPILFETLKSLVDLKERKDKYGVSFIYTEKKKELWQQAKQLIENFEN